MDTTSKRNNAFPAANNPVKTFTSTHAQQARQKQYKLDANTEAAFKASSGVGFGWRNHVVLNED